jgi:hypothetical protein
MTSRVHRSIIVVLALAGSSAAMAQAGVYRSANAVAGQQARLAVVTALKRDCSVGTLGGVKVVTVPKSGTLAVRDGKLKTPASFRCPNVETPVQAVYYTPNPKFSGADEIVYETKSAEGVVERITMKINVTDKPAATKPKGGVVDL